MAKWREVSLGEVVRHAARYRPFASVAVAAVLVAVVLPAAHRDDQAPAPADATTEAAPAAPLGDTVAPSVPGEGLPAGSASAPTRPTATPRTAAARGSSRTPLALPRPGAAADAASAPDCDPRTRRLAVPEVYAPNCVPLWPKGAVNGGATHRGVSATEIVVAIYHPAETIVLTRAHQEAAEKRVRDLKRVIDAFQAHFETYGRRVRWEDVHGSGIPGDDARERADAIRVAEEIGAFASLGAPSNHLNGTNAYTEELAARGVLCIDCGVAQPRAVYERLSPHAWSWHTSMDDALAQTAEFVGKRLHGRPARWAGDPAAQRTTRRFGLIAYDTADGVYADAPKVLRAELARWGARLEVAVQYRLLDESMAQEDARTMIAKLKDAGVTTVIMGVDPITPVAITYEATRQNYFPEWVTIGVAYIDSNGNAQRYDQQQWARAFGLGFRTVQLEKTPPDVVDWHSGFNGTSPHYAGLLMLYMGIHLAGPTLTPASFGAGMASYAPVAGGPTRYGTSFRDALGLRHTASFDFTEVWWDPNAKDSDGDSGAYRYAEMGRRYERGQWPTTEARAFEVGRTVTRYRERPAADRAPTYPYPHAHFRGG